MRNINPNDPEINDTGDSKTTHIKTASNNNIKHNPNFIKLFSIIITSILEFDVVKISE
jgi:hypothetical protein